MAKLESRSKRGAVEAAPAPRGPERSLIFKGITRGVTDVHVRRELVFGKSEQPLQPGTGLLSVIGADERKRIRDTEQSPFRMVCALRINAPWGDFVGTGWFAGPRTIVTAGHCVVDRANMGGWADRIVVTPAQDGDEPPALGSHTATRFSTVDRWEDARDPDFDIGAIHLDEPVGETVGWFGVGALTDDALLKSLVNVSGYPASPGGGVQQWWAKNRIGAVTPRRIFYDVDTSGGQSGGPVYIYERESMADPIVVGIHAYGVGGTPNEIKLEVNSAPRIIPEVVEQIRNWVEADEPAPTTASSSGSG